MRIVHAELEHLDLVAELLHQYRQFYGQNSYYPDCRHFVFDRMTKHESIIFLALDAEEQAIGFLQLYPTFSSVSLQSLWILNDVYVVPEARKQGVGSLLMEEAKAWAAMTESKGLVLETARDNTTAQRLYEMQGFVKDTAFDRYMYAVPPVMSGCLG